MDQFSKFFGYLIAFHCMASVFQSPVHHPAFKFPCTPLAHNLFTLLASWEPVLASGASGAHYVLLLFGGCILSISSCGIAWQVSPLNVISRPRQALMCDLNPNAFLVTGLPHLGQDFDPYEFLAPESHGCFLFPQGMTTPSWSCRGPWHAGRPSHGELRCTDHAG